MTPAPHVPLRLIVANRLIDLRKHSEETQVAVAQAVHILPSALSMYENGRRDPDLAVLVRLARHYRVPLSKIVSEKDLR